MNRPATPNATHTDALKLSDLGLRAQWDLLRAANGKIRIRDAAARLGVSEMELVETGLGREATRLHVDFEPFLHGLGGLGRVMALTRNESCVIETNGEYDGVATFGHAAQVVSPGVDLRIFPSSWVHAFAIEKEGSGRASRSIQIFDAHGTATHKVFSLDGGDLDAFEAFKTRFSAPSQKPGPAPEPRRVPTEEVPDSEIDKDALLDGWAELRDTHDFGRLLRSVGASRTQALRLAEGRFTRAVSKTAARSAIERACGDQVPLMAFVGNRGTIQIYSGLIGRTVDFKQWFNVMDPDFNLHMNEDRVVSAWVVKKNGERGTATSVEIFDEDGKPIVMLFGVRKPGADTGPEWEALTDGIE